jgi:hypothetical protein
MNIPLDNLCHWMQGLVQPPMILYVFHPCNSKDIFDLTQFENIDHADRKIAPDQSSPSV